MDHIDHPFSCRRPLSLAASITTFRRNTSASTPRTPHGLKIIAASATARSLTGAGRALRDPPVLIVRDGVAVAARPSGDGRGNRLLREAISASGLSARQAARALGLNERTLRRMISGELPLAADDPAVIRAADLGR